LDNEKIWKMTKKKSFQDSTYFSSIFSMSFHNSTYFSSIFSKVK
jgi:hypothetical protein